MGRFWCLADTITRDVCIIGGGSTGTYAAIQLKDQKQSVVVVEKKDLLGGHTETLYLPNGQVDYGVQGFFNNKITTDYFAKLGIDHEPLLPGSLKTDNVNFLTGKKVRPPSGLLDTITAALQYRSAIQQFSYLEYGVYNLPDPVPEDLLRPFGEFVFKHNLQGALNLIFLFAHGVGNLLEVPTLTVIANFGIPHINALLQGYIRPKHGAYELFQKATDKLRQDILFQSTVVNATRTTNGVELIVQHADGSRKLIKANKLLLTIPPILSNLDGFDLSDAERSVFQKWEWKSYYAAVLNNTGIPDARNVANLNPNNQPGSLPTTPFIWHLDYPGVSGYLTHKMVGDANFTVQQAKDLIFSDVHRMGTAGTYETRRPNILAFADHTPTTMAVSPEEVRNGFYKSLYALQGQQSTFYTGLAWCSDYATFLWNYTDSVIERMLA
ncbi:hypothetical protein ASPWEDRAFT_743519 [Aspergillus wentii DTO 134E9]|uniref:Amine oxidase domain-containing protein n=1 Tax=Aspergillus wentii DTO 134E9 TaxID=1073089 RepID=A0A1L9RCN7_ASPWE|nr:uncharacterized protein ASPWEDRAFT_743519 [Aspergillus wentii DTO 134E9]OJJ32699.1 hypothetical protein ASPWEDRAFT_743519 [Aspergillus wentii DTO 134E9]